MVLLVGVTFLLSYFPMPAEERLLEPEKRMARLNIRMQVVWFFFSVCDGVFVGHHLDVRTLSADRVET